MKKRLISYALIVVLTLLCACSPASPKPSATPPDAPAPPVAIEDNPLEAGDRYGSTTEKASTVRWLIPVLMDTGDYAASCVRVEELVNRVNAKLLPYDLTLQIELRNVTLERVMMPPDWRKLKCRSYDVTSDIIGILTSKEEYDLISVPTGHVSVPALADMGLLRNVASDLNSFQNLMNALDERQLDAMRYTSGIWGVPAGFDLEANLLEPYLAYRKTTAETLGVYDGAELSTIGDLLYTADRAASSDMISTMFIDHSLDGYHREYAEYPFKVSPDFVFLYTQDGRVEGYAESDIIRQDVALCNRLWEASYNPEINLSIPYSQERVDLMLDKNYDFLQGLSFVTEEKSDDYVPIKLAEDKLNILYDNPYGTICNVIPAQASAYGLAFLDALYGDPAIYEEFREDFPLFDASDRAVLASDWSPATSVYSGRLSGPFFAMIFDGTVDIYRFSLFDCVRQSKLDPEAIVRRYGSLVEEAAYTPMPWDGFVFNPTPVMEDYTRVAERTWGEYMDGYSKPLHFGAQYTIIGRNNEDSLAILASEVDEAGMPVVLEECRRQYAAYLEKTNWSQRECPKNVPYGKMRA